MKSLFTILVFFMTMPAAQSAEISDIFRSADDCIAIVQKDSELCMSKDCEAITLSRAEKIQNTKHIKFCETDDCRAIITGTEAWCASNECKSFITDSADSCKTKHCEAMITGNKSICDSLAASY